MARSASKRMGKLLIASANTGKVDLWTRLLAPYQLELLTPAAIGIHDSPEETGETFAENSLLKSNWYWQKTKLPVLTDDGGLEIDALNGAPGIYSRRIDGVERTDAEARRLILEKISRVPADQRTARLTVVATLRISQDMDFQATASIEGEIRPSDIPAEPGLPYRGILWVPRYNKFLSQLTPAELQPIDHRGAVVAKLEPYINEYLL